MKNENLKEHMDNKLGFCPVPKNPRANILHIDILKQISSRIYEGRTDGLYKLDSLGIEVSFW